MGLGFALLQMFSVGEGGPDEPGPASPSDSGDASLAVQKVAVRLGPIRADSMARANSGSSHRGRENKPLDGGSKEKV